MAKVKIQGHTSGTGILTVTAPNTSTDRTITLPDATGTLLNSDGSAASLTSIPAANITGTLPAIDGSSLTSVNAVNTGNRNVIINGNMEIAQRATSAASLSGSAAFNYYTLDRWVYGRDTDAVVTMSQTADAPAGFKNCLQIDVTTVDSSPTGYVRVVHRIEGQNMIHFGMGVAGTRYITLSFWHKHTKTGINTICLQNYANDRSYVAEYTQSVSNTWEKATITLTADTTGTWVNTSAGAMLLQFALHTERTTSAGSWVAGNKVSTSNQVNNLDSTSNYFRITGVQLELGTAATDFEHRSYGEELLLCRRYFKKRKGGVTALTPSSSGYSDAGNVYQVNVSDMRVNPTAVKTTYMTSGATATLKGHSGDRWWAYGHNFGSTDYDYFHVTLDAEL